MGIYDSIYQYGSGYGNVGAVATPLLTGSNDAPSMPGASNPVGSYLQTGFPTAPNSIVNPNYGIPGIASGPMASIAKPGGVGAVGGIGGSGLGWNLNTAQLALGGLQTIGNLWQAWEANKLAKEQFKFQKDFANENLANQIQSYNTTLEDRTRARSFTEGGSAEDAQAYIDKNKLRKTI